MLPNIKERKVFVCAAVNGTDSEAFKTEQAGTVVLFPDGIVYDANILKSAIGYLLRNDKPIGNLILINEYGKILEIDRIEIRSGLLNKKLKGFY